VQVAATPSSGCYCTAGSNDIAFEKISNVTYNTINNSSTSTAGYENFTAITTNIVQQSTLPITVTLAGGFGTDQVIVWIDFNQNGNFTDPGERVYTSALGVGPHTGTITIPATSLLGPTRMRVRMHDTDAFSTPNATPCGNSGYGQVEDYTVNITPCIPLVITTQPANATIQCGGDATFTVGSTGSGPSFQWEQRTSATAVWTSVANGGVFSGATTNTLTITGAPVSMNGYQYRAVFSGYCRSTDFTDPATLTVNTLVATVNPSSANVCIGAITQLTITNITSPQPASTNAASGPLTLLVPDSPTNPPIPTVLAGVNHSINVAGIPAAAVISAIKVKFNMTHTWDGDMVFVLKAPNGQIINLDYFLNSTGGTGPTSGFVNTVISSTGTTALSAGSNPYTGTFRADRSTSTSATAPAGPTGFAPTTNLWTAMYSNGASANGSWTLAMYDGGAGDEGILTNWDITIDYLAGAPATGVWEPAASNTIFTDAAATVPYVAGTAANSVYVKPATSTDYTVVITTPICVSGVTTIPVTVNNPIGTVTAPSNKTICVNDNTSFTVSAASGNNITYRWQVSTDAGATWTNLDNNNVYGGVTAATLTLTGVPGSFNNNQYRAVLTVSPCTSTVNSGAATLTVNPTPVVTITTGTNTQLYPGITATLTAVSTPAGSSYQWYRNGVAVTGATAATLVVDVDGLGEYSVTVNDVNNCGGASTVSKIISAAPNDIMFIYPSPNTGQFQVRYQSLSGNLLPRTLTVYDSKGSRVYSRTYTIVAPYSRMDVDLGNISKGIYRVELGDHNGARIKTGTVIVL
jgi:subtilisin-like proprotein convertase family protein